MEIGEAQSTGKGAAMHEMGIASSVLDTVKNQAARFPGSRASRVGLRVGEWSGVDVESLRFCLESLAACADLGGLRVEIDFRLRRNRCDQCGWEFRVQNFDTCCPYCANEKTTAIGGTELDVAYVELEESCNASPSKKPS